MALHVIEQDARFPVVIRGSLDVTNWHGLVATRDGESTQAQRIQNGVEFQKAINYAVDNRKFFEVPHPGPGLEYAIESATGLTIPIGATGFEWQGQQGVVIKQFQNNAPVLTVGGATETQRILVDGVALRYNEDQAGNTSSVALKLGALWQSTFRRITTGAAHLSARPYVGCDIIPSEFFFSNIVEDCRFFRSEQSMLRHRCLGTGNIFRNVYCSGRTSGGVAGAVAIPVEIDAAGSALQENVYEQLNIEWCIAPIILTFENVRQISMISTHFEGNRLSGASGAFVYSVISSPNFHGLVFLSNRIDSADGASGSNNAYFKGWQSGTINVNGCYIEATGNIDLDHYLFYQGDGSDGYEGNPAIFQMRNFRTSGHSQTYANLSIDRALPRASFGTHVINSAAELYSFEPNSDTKGLFLKPTASMTVWGCHENPCIHIVNPLTADIDIVCSNVKGPAATRGAGVPIQAGRQICVRRASAATGAFNVNVRNHDNALLSAISVPATRASVYYNGTNWIVGT